MSNIIDEHCSFRDGTIYEKYSCTLNQTDIKNNRNKFYIMQIIKKSSNKGYCLFVRYGRVGEQGVISYPVSSGEPESCVSKFISQFKSKTGNVWNSSFEPKKGKYWLCDMEEINTTSTTTTSTSTTTSNTTETEPPKCKLDQRVQNLITLISDVEAMNKTMISLNIDTKKLPLGKLSQTQIDKGYKILDQLRILLDSKTKTDDEIMDLCSAYYTIIPYVCNRGQRPPIINTTELIQKCVETLDELSNITVAANIMTSKNTSSDNDVHPIDKIYNQLNTNILAVDKDSDTWKIINNYVTNTHAPTHSNYSVEIIDIYEIQRPNTEYKTKYGSFENRQLLWHGTRLSNFVSILQKGLLLRPDVIPGTYISGKMFGYGIYGANSFSKSFNYTGATSSDPVACLFLAEFALGKTSNRRNADYSISKDSLQKIGCDSTWGQGIRSPCGYETLADGTIVPNGKLTSQGSSSNYQLQYDEFIVYDQSQLDLRYIVNVKGKFKY